MRELLFLALAAASHEAGHLLAAKALGIPLRRANMTGSGGRLTFDFSRSGYGREALVHLAGPAAGILAAAAALILRFPGGERFAGMSLVLSEVNLLPMQGFDGGGILRCVLSSRFWPDTVERVGRIADGIVRLGLWIWAIRLALSPVPRIAPILFFVSMLLGETIRRTNETIIKDSPSG